MVTEKWNKSKRFSAKDSGVFYNYENKSKSSAWLSMWLYACIRPDLLQLKIITLNSGHFSKNPEQHNKDKKEKPEADSLETSLAQKF